MNSQPRVLTIAIQYPGLGDQLFWSHIPRIAKDKATRGGGYDKVYVRLCNPSRDPQYIKLIWENNPYVDKVITDSTDPLPTPSARRPSFSYTRNLLDNHMLELGLDDGKRLHEPEIYYKPKFREEYHKVIFDPNWISGAGRIQTSDVMHFFETNDIQLDAVLAKRNDNCLFDYRAGVEVIETKSLEDFCDLIYSAKAIYCFVTGTASLAAALGKSANVIVGDGKDPYFLHSPLHTYTYLRMNKNLYKVLRPNKRRQIRLKVRTINRLSSLLPTKKMRLAFRNLFACENLHRIKRFVPSSGDTQINTLLDIAKELDIIGDRNKGGGIVFEFGSRYGEDSVGFAKFLQDRGIDAHIYSFECNDKTLPQCLEAVAPYPNITLTQKAISQTDGFITFYSINAHETKTTHSDGNQGASSMFKASGKYPIEQYVQDEVRVPSTRLDSFMREHNVSHIDILWMDIQGGELEALKSLGDRLQDVNLIYTEVEFMEIYEGQPLFEDIKGFLEERGFMFVGVSDRNDYFANALFIHTRFYRTPLPKSCERFVRI
ncbi:FkbM family methyltransferase [uncultured Helicobacter sp.]|uniref:FkbM family methyltransferase n=1 Tax=uncultured Helicobacter sp. TaxID=175537 RepID=UPI00374EBD74